MTALKNLYRAFVATLQNVFEMIFGVFHRLFGAAGPVPVPPAVTPPERTALSASPATSGPPLAGLELASMVRRVAHRLLANRDAGEMLASLPAPIARDLRGMRRPDLLELLRVDLPALAARLANGRLTLPTAHPEPRRPFETSSQRHIVAPDWETPCSVVSPRGP